MHHSSIPLPLQTTVHTISQRHTTFAPFLNIPVQFAPARPRRPLRQDTTTKKNTDDNVGNKGDETLDNKDGRRNARDHDENDDIKEMDERTHER